MKKIFQQSILKQFKLVLYCLLTLTLVLAVICYGFIYRLMTKSAASYAQDTAGRFESEIQYILRRADSIFVNLMFDPNIERLLLSPYSENTPEYINSLCLLYTSPSPRD